MPQYAPSYIPAAAPIPNQIPPANYLSHATATESAPQLNPAAAQMGYNPAAQLGSNTAVECLKYVDGSGLLIVSAEEYRFKNNQYGMGIDDIVKMLDDPAMNNLGTGSQMFIYMPKFVPAINLQSLISNVGMNVSDVVELWQGQDLVTVDNSLNWLIFDVSNYSCDNIAKLLAQYDVPIPQVKITLRVYEVYSENDDRMGIDFQSWKNNEGTDFFSVGGRYRNNWAAIYGGAGNLNRIYGSERSSFYNFNPRWNTRYLDFLTARGSADIVHTGTLVLRNNTGGTFSRTTKIFFSDSSNPSGGSISLPDAPEHKGYNFLGWRYPILENITFNQVIYAYYERDTETIFDARIPLAGGYISNVGDCFD
jgi:hypothetical protein